MSLPSPRPPAEAPLSPDATRGDGPTVASATGRVAAGWRRWAPWVLGAGVLAGGWHGLLAHWLPGWLPGQVQPVLARQLGTPVTWQALEIQPWTLRVTLRGLSVGPQADPLLAVRAITVQPSWEVLWRWAPVLRRVTVEGARLHVARLAPGQFNFSPLVAHWQQAHPPQPDQGGEPVRFAVFNIALEDSAVVWRDEVLHQQHEVDRLHLTVPFVSNLPSLVEVETEPALSARVDGSQLAVQGESLPFTQGRRSQVQVHWHDIALPEVLEAVQPFLPPAWRPQSPAGTLAADLKIEFEARVAPAVPKLGVTGRVAVSGMALAWPRLPVALPAPAAMAGLRPVRPGAGVAAHVSWDQLVFDGIDAQPLVQQVHLGAVQLSGLKAQVRPAQAAVSGATPGAVAVPAANPAVSAQPGKAEQPSGATQGQPWQWSVGQVKLVADELDVQPWGEVPGVKPWPRVQALVAQVSGLSGEGRAQPATWRLGWHDSAGGQFDAQGRAHIARGEGQAKLAGTAWSLADWSQMATWLVAAPVRLDDGRLNTQAQVSWGPQGVNWQAGAVQVSQLLLAPAKAPAGHGAPANHVAWRSLDVQGIQGQWPRPTAGVASAPTPELKVDSVAWQGLDVAVLREAHNTWFGLALPPSNTSVATTAAKPTTAGASTATAPWRLVLDHGQCTDCKLQLNDHAVTPAARLALGPMRLLWRGLDTGHLEQPVQLGLDTRALDTGRVQVDGQVRLEPLQVDAQVRTSQVDLKVLQPYLDPYLNVVLMGARPEVDGRVRWAAATPKAAQQVRFNGHLGLAGLQLQDRVNAADFLSWRRFAMDGVAVALDGDKVDAQLGRIQLQDFYGRVIVNPDGRLNLASILRSERDGATTSITTPQQVAAAASAASPASAPSMAAVAASTPGPAATVAAAQSPKPQLAWQRVRLSGGRIDFTDHFIRPNYSARLTQVQGDVSAVSSRQTEPADLSLSGAVDDAAPLRISGKVQPLGPQLFTDIEGSAKGIELTRLTPYAARYAGYDIDKGTLSVTVHYKIDQGKLDATNRVFLDQLTFGDASNSPDAVKLPIRFAVSLLTNARGEIDLNLPISGSINDPKFSVGGIVWQVLVNLITKAVSAPFALLGGGDGEDWGQVPFDPGSAELNDTARRRLEGLAKSLLDRPALKLEATGHADVATDTLALRQRHLDQLLRAAKARATGQPLADTTVGAAEADTWLAAAYKAADIPKPRNALGLAKALPPAEMRTLLMASAPTGEDRLRELADDRADQVKAFLAARMPPERVRLTASEVDPVGAEAQAAQPTARVQMVLR